MSPSRLVPAAVVAAVLLAGCGGSGGGGHESAKSDSGLVADVTDAQAKTLASGAVTASARVRVGGTPGKHLTLEWGLVDAQQGNESQTERVVRRYVTAAKVVSGTESVTIPKKVVVSPLLVHFVIYAPDGSYLSSADTPVFGPGS